MTTMRKNPAAAQRSPTRTEAGVFGYAVPRHQIRSLATEELPDDAISLASGGHFNRRQVAISIGVGKSQHISSRFSILSIGRMPPYHP